MAELGHLFSDTATYRRVGQRELAKYFTASRAMDLCPLLIGTRHTRNRRESQ
jgi:hypothetical protein